MVPSCFLVFLMLVSGIAASAPLTYVIAPLEAQVEADKKKADRARQLLIDALRARPGVRVVPPPQGWSHEGQCQGECLMGLLKETGADRAVGGWLMMQAKVYFPGVHWHIRLDQVDAKAGGGWGWYEKSYVSSVAKKRFFRPAAKMLVEMNPQTWLPPISARPEAPANAPNEPEMALVPAGEFIMGSRFGEENEGPRHRVYLDAFYVDLYESSNAEYKGCVEAGVCRRSRFHRDPDLGRDTHPVAGINYKDATTYCEWRGKRLPTEAEWERAARGLDERRWPWGNTFDPAKVNMRHDVDGWASSAPVKAFPEGRSPVGAYQMAGNVWEWTQDWFAANTYRRKNARNPKGPRSGPRKIIRGGSWRYDIPFYVSSHNRSHSRIGSRVRHVGGRCVKDGPKLP